MLGSGSSHPIPPPSPSSAPNQRSSTVNRDGYPDKDGTGRSEVNPQQKSRLASQASSYLNIDALLPRTPSVAAQLGYPLLQCGSCSSVELDRDVPYVLPLPKKVEATPSGHQHGPNEIAEGGLRRSRRAYRCRQDMRNAPSLSEEYDDDENCGQEEMEKENVLKNVYEECIVTVPSEMEGEDIIVAGNGRGEGEGEMITSNSNGDYREECRQKAEITRNNVEGEKLNDVPEEMTEKIMLRTRKKLGSRTVDEGGGGCDLVVGKMSNNIEECAQYKISTKNEGGARQYRSLICGLAPLQSSVVGRPSPPSLPSKEDDDYVVPPDPHALSLHLTRLLNDPSPLLPYPLPDGSICSDNNRDTLSVPCAPTHASLLAHAELDLFCGPSNGAISHRPLHPHVSYFAALYCVRRSDWDASFHRACDLRWFRFEDGWEDDDGSFPSLWEEAAAKVLMAAVEGRACSIRERIRNMLVRCIVAGVATLTVAWTGGWCLGAACAGWAEAVLCTAGVQVVRVLAAFVFFFEIWDDNIHYGYGQECRQKLAETSMAPSDITERFWLRRCTLSTGAMTFKSPYLARITLTLVSIQQWIQATERVGQDGTFLQRSVYFLYSILLLLWNLSIGSIQLICVRASYCFEGIFERILSLLTKEFPYDDDTDEDFIKSKEHLVKKLGTTLGLRSHGDVVVIWRRRSKRLHDEAVYYAQEVLMARSPLAEECANAATPSNRESHHHTIMTSLQRRHHHHRHASSFSHKMYHGLSSSSRRRWHHQESHQYYRRRNSFRVRSNITEEMAAEEHHGCGIEVRIETPECHTSHCRQTPGLHQSGDVGSGNMPCPIYHRHGTGSRFEWHRSPGTTHMLTHQEGDISLADSTCGTPLALPASDFVAGTMQRTICEEDCHPDGNGTEVRSFRNVDNMGPTSLSLSSSTEKENVGGWNVLIGRAQKKKCHHASPTSTRFSVGRFSYFGKGHAPTNMTTAPSPPPLPLSPTSAPSPSFSPISNGGHRNRQARHLLSFSSSLANGAMRSWRTTRPPPVTIPPVPPYHDPWRDEGVSALDPSIPDVAHVTPPPHPRDASFPDVPSLPWWDDKRRDPVAPIPVPETYIPEHRRHHTIHGKHLASRSYSSSSAVEDQYFLGQEEEFQGLHSGRSPILRPSSLCSSSRKRQLHVDEHYEEDSDSFSDSCYEGGSVCTDMSFDTNSEVGTVITLGTDVTAGGGLGRSPGGRGMGGERLDARQWVDVGVRLGVRLLNNDAVQRVIAPKINATTAAKPVMEGEGGQRLLDPGDGIILSASSLLNESQGGLKDSTALLKDAGGSAPQRIEERGAAMQLLNRIKKASAVDLPSATTGGLGEIPTKNETFRIGEEGKDETLEYEISDKKLLSSSSTTDEVIISTGEHMITSTHVVPKHSIWTTASCLLPMVTATHGHDQEQPQGPTAKQHVYHNKKDQLNRNKQVPYRSPSNRRSRTAYVQYHGNSAKRRSVCIDAPPPSPSSEPIFCHVNTSTSSSPDYWPNSNSFGESDLGLTTTTTSTNISMNTNTPRRKWHSNTELQYHLGSSLAPPQPEPEPIKTTNTTTADTTFNMRKILESAAVHADFFEGRAVCGKIDPWESVTAAYIVPPTSQPLHPESSCPHHRRSSLVSTEDCESGNGLLRQNSAVGSCIEVTLERQMPRRNKYQHAPLARGCKVVVPLFPQAWNLPGCFEPKPRRKGETRLVPHQMATVVSSRRIYVPPTSRDRNVSSQIPQTETNTLELVLHLDRCFLRNGQFAVLHHRIPDTSPLPRHSAYPIGSPVITSFGLAILVGWRVEDDVHVVRNLWGRGRRDSAAAYLHRKSLRGRAEASVGFEVDTDIGRGVVLGYVGSGGKDWRGGKYVVSLHRVAGSRCGSERSLRDTNVPNNSRGRSMGTANAHFTNGRDIVMLDGRKIRGCKSAVFVPVLEQIREAARYQIQYDAYEAALIDTERRARGASYLQLRMLGNGGGLLLETKSDESDADSSNLFVKKRSSRGLTLSDLEVFLSSLLRAINESPSLGEDFNAFMSSFIEVVERIGTTAIDMTRHKGKERERREKEKCNSNDGYDATARSGERVQWIMPPDEESIVKSQAIETDATVCTAGGPDSTRNNSANFPDFSVIDDLLGFLTNKDKGAEETSATTTRTHKTSLSSSFSSTAPLSSDQLDDQNDPTVKREKRAFIILSVLLRAVAIAKVNVRDRADIKIALSGVRETLLLIRTIIQVRTQNISQHTRTLRRQTRKKLEQFIGPIQRRLGHFGKKLLTRIEREGEKNRIKHSRFLELLIRDGRLIRAVDNERWEKCLSLVERAIVKAQIVDAKTLAQYKQSVMLLYHTLAPTSGGQASAKRNTEKLARLAKVLKVLLSPKRTLLKFVQKKEVLDALERIMVRVFSDDAEASMMLNIYAFNFHNFRELILLRNQDIAGSFWERLLDAAHEEFEWGVTRMPEQMRDFGEPFSDLFLMGVCSLKRKRNGEQGSWLNFLDDEKAVALINELELKLIESITFMCDDVKDMVEVMPYYATIDDDILNLLDQVELEKVLLESIEAMVDKDRFFKHLRDKSFAAIDRFLDYLPKLSIPVDKRELPGGWLLTCRGKGGGDLTLSQVNLSRENMVCKLIGSDNLLALDKKSPAFASATTIPGVSSPPNQSNNSVSSSNNHPLSFDIIKTESNGNVEVVSVLDEIRALLLNAENHGYWGADVQGMEFPGSKSSNIGSKLLKDVPVSKKVNRALEKWAKHEIDDDQLMEVAIRDVSHHIRMKEGLVEAKDYNNNGSSREKKDMIDDKYDRQGRYDHDQDTSPDFSNSTVVLSPSPCSSNDSNSGKKSFFDNRDWKFNPKKDPTVLNLEIKNLMGKLDQFLFRVEPKFRNNIFDPVFQGTATLTIKDTSIRLKVSCHKERLIKLGKELVVPVFQLQELDLNLNKVNLVFEETGADWMLNKIVTGLNDIIKESVEANLKTEMANMINDALEHFNSFVEVNSEATLKVLGIKLDDLKENIVWV